jgi:hypothetical protein
LVVKRLLAPLLFVTALPAAAGAQDENPEIDPGRLGSTEGAEPDVPLTPAQKEALIDKPWIASQTWERLVGLREEGNPHIRRGLLLSNIEDDPQRSQVDLEKLREERIRQIERDAGAPEETPLFVELRAPARPRVDAPPRQEPPAAHAEEGGLKRLVLAVSAIVGLGAVILYLRATR